MGDLNKDNSRIKEHGFVVDDNQEPAPENIQTASTTGKLEPCAFLFHGQSWGWDGNCQHLFAIPTKQKAGFHNNWLPQGKNNFTILQKFIPQTWFEEVSVKGTSSNLEAADEPGTNLGEMFCYLGLKLLMATMVGFTQHQYISSHEFN